MLLYRPDPKPLSEIAVGESFQILVTEADWNEGEQMNAGYCAVAVALRGITDSVPFVVPGMANIGTNPRMSFVHDGAALISAFDLGGDFPGPTVVTFTRES